MADRRPSAIGDLRQQTEAARVLHATYRDIVQDDEAARHDLVEGETNLHEALHACIERLAELKALQAGIKTAADTLKARKDRFEGQEERLRAAMLAAMEVASLPRLETPLGTVSRKAVPPSVVVTSEADVPSQFWKRADPTLDRRALLAALKELPAGERIPGAELSNGGATISVKLT
jgi:hypothetical protein